MLFQALVQPSTFCSAASLLIQFWNASLDLRSRDKDVIEKGGLPCDRHMHAANKLLSSQFLAIQGM